MQDIENMATTNVKLRKAGFKTPIPIFNLWEASQQALIGTSLLESTTIDTTRCMINTTQHVTCSRRCRSIRARTTRLTHRL